MKMRALLAALTLWVFSRAATAAVITFSGLPGPHLAPMPNPYVEGTFNVTPTTAFWRQTFAFGNPFPSIFSSSGVAVVEVTQNTIGQFTFSSVDLAEPSGSPVTY